MKDIRELVPTSPEKRDLERQVDIPQGNYPMYRAVQQEEGFRLADYWRAIRKRLWLVIGITILMTTLAAIYMARRPDVFQAKARVQIDSEQANPDLQTSDRPMRSNVGDTAYFNTQLQNLTNDSLLRRVVKELNIDTNPAFLKMRGEGSVSAWQGLLRSVGLASKPEKKEEKGVGEVTNLSSVASGADIEEAIRLAPFVDILKRNMTADPIRESRATNKDTRLIELTYKDNNPELAAFVVNGISDIFAKTNQEKRTKTSSGTSDYLQEKIATYQTDIKKDEQNLLDLKQKAGRLDTSENETLAIQELQGLSRQLQEAENLRKLAEAQYFSVKGNPAKLKALADEKLAPDFTARNMSLSNFVNEASKKIADLKVERQALLREYTDDSPEVKDKDSQIKELEKAIKTNVDKNQTDLDAYRKNQTDAIIINLEREFNRTKAVEDKIRVSYNKQYSEAQGQDNAGIQIKILEEKIKTNKEFLQSLTKQERENNVVAVGSENNISVVDIAIPPDVPISPRRLTTVVAAMLLSTLFGAGLALFLEYLDDTIHSTEEVETHLGLPAIAAIPTIDSAPKRRLLLVGGKEEIDENYNSELLIYADPRSALAEAYRQLRTSILLSTAGHAPKSLLVTSSLPAEGKTTTAVNTAISLAQTGAKVLIVDADMRRPRLHSIFNKSNAQGLSTLLSSQMEDADLFQTIQQDEASKVYLLASGPVPPNPAELLGSEQMSVLMGKLERTFTHIVVDSPPIASFTDGVLVGSLVDGVILVVHSGKSSRQVIKRSRQLLQDVGAKIFGVVLNNVNLKAQNSYYYQSYYSQNYYRRDDDE
jgi:polysaccharide biosynthesis transport protein